MEGSENIQDTDIGSITITKLSTTAPSFCQQSD